MDDGVLQAALALPEEDRRELAERIRESLVSREEGDPGSCPRCGCSHVVRRGRDADGAQRWLCRGCGRTFTARTGGLVALSKLPSGPGSPTSTPRSRGRRSGVRQEVLG